MNMRKALVTLACVAWLVGCDGDGDTDAGTDGGMVMLMDAGPDVDSGPGSDAGPGSDSGPGGDAGPGTDGATSDSGPGDAGPPGDAGCTPMTCGTFDCGMIDDGCGTMIDCGTCAVGAPCAMDSDCASMECITETDSAWPGGYCTAQCRYDADCAAGTHCGYRNDLTLLGVCVADCTTDADCRMPDYSCRDADEAGTNECAPVGSGTGTIGSACTATSDCAGGADGFCIPEGTQFNGGFCTQTCAIDADCGAGNHCGFIPPAGGDGVCLPNCTMDSDCRMTGYSCYNADEDAGGVTECWSGGTGTAAIGDPCTGVWECSGGGDAICQTEAGNALGGYCLTTGCTVGGTDCAAGSHCVAFGMETACLADCTTGADCRTMGYACYDVDGDTGATTECWIAGTGTAAVGDACTGTFDCAGGDRAFCLERPANDFAGGYCTLFGCTNPPAAGSDCPAGSHCTIFTDAMGVPNPTGLCTDDCTMDSDCRMSGYGCYDNGDVDLATECWPAGTGTAVTGEACRWIEDCAGDDGAICLIDQIGGVPPFRGGYCTDTCTTAADCSGTGASCQSGLCWEACTVPLDCRMMDQYTCTIPMFAGFSANICWPT